MIERPPTLSTPQNGSMRTTGVSVADITRLSSRLSRISIEWTWWRPSAGISAIGDGGVNDDMVGPRLRGDDRPHGLAIERAGQIASLQSIDNLDRAAVLGIPHELEHSM